MSLPGVKPSVVMKTGDKVLEALGKLEVSQSEVARRVGVTPQSVGRWIKGLNDDSITDEQWESFARGLRSVGLRPEDYRAMPPPRSILNVSLIPLLDLFKTKEQLTALVTILSAKDDARATLMLLAQERLRLAK